MTIIIKRKITPALLAVSAVFAFSGVAFSVASAEAVGVVNVQTDVNARVNMDRSSASTTVKHDDEVKSNRDISVSSKTYAKGEWTSEQHRSEVATFVHSLLNVADRENGNGSGIGAQVRVVARDQNNSASTTADAMAKIEHRNKLRVLLFGSDYKHLGVLRSEVATTTKNIERLKVLLSQTTDVNDRAELSAQIAALEELQVKVNAYITARENLFSFFGWFVKRFSKDK